MEENIFVADFEEGVGIAAPSSTHSCMTIIIKCVQSPHALVTSHPSVCNNL